MSQSLVAQDLSPAQPHLRDATMEAFKDRADAGELEKFLAQASAPAAATPIGATASVKIAIWGKVHCEPDGQPWVYDATIWGGPAYGGDAVGFMYTAYDSWDPFFQNVTGVHCQGIAEAGGVLQINWFLTNGTPVGQFNGVA